MSRRPERDQLPFDFWQTELTPGTVYPTRHDLNMLVDADEEAGRFVRKLTEPVAIRTVADVGHYVLRAVYTPFEQFEQEELWVHLLNTKNYLIYDALVYRGSVDTIGTIRAAEIFRPAVRINATSLILSHSHPSGDCEPSPSDIHATTTLIEAGQILGISVLDHLVVGLESWVSLRERGVAFSS